MPDNPVEYRVKDNALRTGTFRYTLKGYSICVEQTFEVREMIVVTEEALPTFNDYNLKQALFTVLHHFLKFGTVKR